MDEDMSWHIKKEISVGHMISTATLFVAMVFAWDNLGDRVDRLETRTQNLEQTDNRQSDRMEKLQQSINGKLTKIDEKVDRLIDRMLDNGNK